MDDSIEGGSAHSLHVRRECPSTVGIPGGFLRLKSPSPHFFIGRIATSTVSPRDDLLTGCPSHPVLAPLRPQLRVFRQIYLVKQYITVPLSVAREDGGFSGAIRSVYSTAMPGSKGD